MRVRHGHLRTLLNRLYDRGDESFTVSHPAEEIGDLLRINLGDVNDVTVEFTTSIDEYAAARNDVGRHYPDDVYQDLPDPADYRNALVASGIVEIANRDDVETFLDRYGDPDLMAGHPPVFAGFDTNLMPWRIDRILGLGDPTDSVGYVNGFVLATGVRDELDWDYKCHNTTLFEDAFGDQFDAYWNQPLGAARTGRLGLLSYRTIRDIEQAQEIQSDQGDEGIIDAYDQYNRDNRADILLFSNDRNFIERARSHTLLAQRIDFPDTLPQQTTATWRAIDTLLYMLALVFGILEVPSTTVYGVWRGKDEHDWQEERVKLDARSPKLRNRLEGDLSIVESYTEFANE